MEATETETEKELMRHALGLNKCETIGYRNHFFTYPGCDTYQVWTGNKGKQ